MNNFIENEYFNFLNFKNLRSETQKKLDTFCSYYLDNYQGTNKENLEALQLFFNKFLKDNQKDSIFVSVFQCTLKINIYDYKINFLAINDALDALNAFINEFKNFLID